MTPAATGDVWWIGGGGGGGGGGAFFLRSPSSPSSSSSSSSSASPSSPSASLAGAGGGGGGSGYSTHDSGSGVGQCSTPLQPGPRRKLRGMLLSPGCPPDSAARPSMKLTTAAPCQPAISDSTAAGLAVPARTVRSAAASESAVVAPAACSPAGTYAPTGPPMRNEPPSGSAHVTMPVATWPTSVTPGQGDTCTSPPMTP